MRNAALLDSKHTTQLHLFLVANHPEVPKKLNLHLVFVFWKQVKEMQEISPQESIFPFSNRASFIPKHFSVHRDWWITSIAYVRHNISPTLHSSDQHCSDRSINIKIKLLMNNISSFFMLIMINCTSILENSRPPAMDENNIWCWRLSCKKLTNNLVEQLIIWQSQSVINLLGDSILS